MVVRNIIKSKDIKDIVSVRADDTVSHAASILSERRIGALIVTSDDNPLAGILSERDIVRALGKTGASCMDQKVSTLMTSDVKHCSPDETALSALERMSKGRFRHLPVVEDGKLVAVISIGDAVNARLKEIQAENSALTGMISNNW